MKKQLDLARDILDKPVVDREVTKMGRIDGLILELRGDQPPRIDAIEMGFAVLARRMSPRVEGWLEKLRRFSIRKTARQLVPWEKVIEVKYDHIRLDLKAIDTPAFAWERWLRDHFVLKVGGTQK
ncbi:MAG TPA: hypothetical protein VH394_00800 [Thermoanaerobaculia bacterium]|jgi:hypothetical protein|nr:hypothetical protein [Thermoanaerobaculia bacterium]